MRNNGFGRRTPGFRGADDDAATATDKPAVGRPSGGEGGNPNARGNGAEAAAADLDAMVGRLRAAVRDRVKEEGGALEGEARDELGKEIRQLLVDRAASQGNTLSDDKLDGLVARVFEEPTVPVVAAARDEAPKPVAAAAPASPTTNFGGEPFQSEATLADIAGPATRPSRRRMGRDDCSPRPVNVSTSKASVETAKEVVAPILMERIDAAAAAKLTRDELSSQISEIVAEILFEEKIRLNALEHRELVDRLLNDMLGLGPLEPLLADETVTDILVNGPDSIYVERSGKLEQTDVRFRDDSHVMNIATRIVTRIGRRVDESSPLCDARLADGSRVNIIIPPLAIDGPSISIRKFSKKAITLDTMVRQQNLSKELATVLRIAARARLNILISGGTGSGKTTLLNAISQMIDPTDRIVTIEDAAELKLQQPHVVRLETRPPNLEGDGEITMRDLVKNSLRMRPDRIILGEVRSSEAVDMLQAMNTGHEGSLGTIHANRPREALTRLENMVGMAGINLPSKAVRTQIASALDMIVQISRMRDGVRRITNVMEVIGMEGDVITTQELFAYKFEGEDSSGRLIGRFESSGLRPFFMPKAEYFGLDRPLMEAMG